MPRRHGRSGNGVTSKYGLNGIANYHDEKYLKMADGEIYNTITNGHNSMYGYGANLTVNDRWAIVTYVRSLQRSQLVKLEELPPDRTARRARRQTLMKGRKLEVGRTESPLHELRYLIPSFRFR